MARREQRSARFDPLTTMSYGPFGYLGSAITGFVAGTVLFIIGDAVTNNTPGGNVVAEMPISLVCAGGGALLLLLSAAVANYVLGRSIRSGLELQRTACFDPGEPPPLFDDLGEKLVQPVNARGIMARHGIGDTFNIKVIHTNLVETDTNTVSDVHVSPGLGRAASGMGDNHEHGFSKAARR